MRIANHLVATTICYEDTFPQLATVRNPEITAMINLSEDGWFEGTTAIPQRIQISRMRAIENERYFIRVSNNGTSAVIDHNGIILKSNRDNPRESFEAIIQPRTGMTPYMMYGEKLIMGIVFLILAIFIGPQFWQAIKKKLKAN